MKTTRKWISTGKGSFAKCAGSLKTALYLGMALGLATPILGSLTLHPKGKGFEEGGERFVRVSPGSPSIVKHRGSQGMKTYTVTFETTGTVPDLRIREGSLTLSLSLPPRAHYSVTNDSPFGNPTGYTQSFLVSFPEELSNVEGLFFCKDFSGRSLGPISLTFP